jgi:6-phosphogluconolactonase (cycloisomerase 2 family)
VTNTFSDPISSYRIDHDGSITLVNATAGEIPDELTQPCLNKAGIPCLSIDTALSKAGRFLYTFQEVTGLISAFRVQPDGSLTHLGEGDGLPNPPPFPNSLAALRPGK